MPELPEVETIVRGLQQYLVGQKIVRARVNLPKIIRGDKESFVSLIEGASIEIEEVRRQGKIIILGLSNGMSILIHLKLTGQLLYTLPKKPVVKHTHLVFSLSGGKELRYVDLRQFGYFLLTATSQLSRLRELSILGPEPLEISSNELKRLISKRKARIKSLLLNQSFLAGIGNIYADEILHLSGINPLQPAHMLNDPKIKRLHQAIRKVLTRAIKYRGSSVSDYLDLAGQEGSYQRFHQVYQREGKPCLTCQAKITRLKIGNRSSYFCPNCQSYDHKKSLQPVDFS